MLTSSSKRTPSTFLPTVDGATSSNGANDLCKVAIILPSEASLLNIIHQGGIEGRMLPCSDLSIFVGKFADHFHVALTTGHSRTLEQELATCCTKDADVVVVYPALFAEVLQLRNGSPHRLEICELASMNATLVPSDNVANLVAGLFQSAFPSSVNELLTSPGYCALFPNTWVSSPVEVDGIVAATVTPLLLNGFKKFKVYPVAVCTGKAEQMAGARLHEFLDSKSRYVCDFVRVAVMSILRRMEQTHSIEKAIHLESDMSVPTALLYSNEKMKRMLPDPKNDSVLERNQRIVKEFFITKVHSCLDNLTDIEQFGVELVGEDGLERTKNNASMCGRELISQIFLQWKRQVGKKIDFVPLMNIFEKLGHQELKDRCEMFVTEHSFRFKLHPLDCYPCFVRAEE